MLRNSPSPTSPAGSTFLNEVLSLNAQELLPATIRMPYVFLNEVLSLNAQE